MEPNIQTAGNTSPHSETINKIIRKIEGGDASAMAVLYDQTSPLIFGLITRIIGERGEGGERTASEEVLLNVYTKAWKECTTRDREMPVLEWLVQMAREMALARLHSGKREANKQEWPKSAAISEPTVIPGFQKLVRSSIAAVGSVERGLLERAFYTGASCAEIAAAAGKPLGAVKTQIRTGLGRFIEIMETPSGKSMNTQTASGGEHREA